MLAVLVCFTLCADSSESTTIPAEALTYLKGANIQHQERITLLVKEEARLNDVLKALKSKQREEMVARIDRITSEIKQTRQSPAMFRFTGTPQVGALGQFGETAFVTMIGATDLALVQVKYNKVNAVGTKDPLRDEAIGHVLISGIKRDKPDAIPVLKSDALYRAIRIEQDTPLAESAINAIPRAAQGGVAVRNPTAMHSIVVVESVDSSIVDSHREAFEKVKPSIADSNPAKKMEIPDDVLAYLKAEDAHREELIDVHQREIARLKVLFKQAPARKHPEIVAGTKVVIDEIKRLEQSPVKFRFPGVPPVGSLGLLEEASVVSTFEGSDLVLVRVKHAKIKNVGPRNPLEDEVLSYVLVSGLGRDKPGGTPVLKPDALYRAVRVERDTPFAESAIAKIPRATQATVSRRTPVAIRSLVVLEPIESSVVDAHREHYERIRPQR